MVKTKGIQHITLTVSDLEKSKEFYSKVCGMRILSADQWSVGLSDGSSSVWLSTARDEPSTRPFNRNNVGLDHWAFGVSSMEDLKEIEQHLKVLNVPMEDDGITDDDFGGTAIFTTDPDGMKIEFHLVTSEK